MSDSNRYTTINLHEELKHGFESLKEDGETYNDVMRRALAALSSKEEKRQEQFDYQNEKLHEQNRMLVRMVVKNGLLDKEDIPRGMAEDERFGDADPADPNAESTEPTLDVHQEERAEEMRSAEGLDALGKVLGEGAPAEADTLDEAQEQLADDMAASDEPDEGYTDGFDDNGDDH
jgi:hypothetical protein